MILKGENSEIFHNKERYHIQTESWAPLEQVLVAQVFKGGQLVFKKKMTLEDVGGDFNHATLLKAHEGVIKELKELLI